MRKIKIIREHENFNQDFDYKIFVDNVQITKLRNGEEKLIKLNENTEFLEVKINSGASKKLPLRNLKSGQEILVSGDRFKNKYLKYAGALFPLISLTFILKHNYEIIKILGGVIFVTYLLFIIFVLIFQKRKWIMLQLIN